VSVMVQPYWRCVEVLGKRRKYDRQVTEYTVLEQHTQTGEYRKTTLDEKEL